MRRFQVDIRSRVMTLSFAVRGVTPVPQGSKKMVAPYRMIEANPNLQGWREAVQSAAMKSRKLNGIESPLDCPVSVSVIFLFARPQGHYGKRGLRPTAPAWMSNKPDVDKLARGLLDGMTHILIRDDSQVVSLCASKRFCHDDELPGLICQVIPHPLNKTQPGTLGESTSDLGESAP